MNDILAVTSVIISILSFIISIMAVRYTKKQVDLEVDKFEEQKRKESFSIQISDTYYHRAEDDQKCIECLGVILSLNNPSEVPVFVRYLDITFVFSVADIRKLSFWQTLLWARSPEVARFTIPYPPDGSSSLSGRGWFSFPIFDVRCLPQHWVFDRRTDELITFDAPVEIPKDVRTILWELVVLVPLELWKSMRESNLTMSKMDITLTLSDGRSQNLEARFGYRPGPKASSRERVTQLIMETLERK